MTKKEFNLIKEVINERIKLDEIGQAIRLVTLYNRHELINNRVMERLFNCLDMIEKNGSIETNIIAKVILLIVM